VYIKYCKGDHEGRFVVKEKINGELTMSITVNNAQFKSAFKASIKCLEEKNIRIPFLLHGVHGIGKTEVVKQVASDLGYNCCPLYLSTQDVSDLIGLPTKEYDDNGKVIATRFAEPDWLQKAKADDRPCIFYLDEMNRAPQYVLQTMLPFVLDGTLHTHEIREGDVVIGAMNPDTADYNVESITDEALLSRFAHFYFEPTVDEWATFCIETKCHSAILSLIDAHTEAVERISVKDEERIHARPDRRSLWKIGQIMNILDDTEIDQIGIHLFTAMVGADISTPLVVAYKDSKFLKVEDILSGKAFTVHKVDFEMELDKVNVVNETLVSRLADGSNGKTLWERKIKEKTEDGEIIYEQMSSENGKDFIKMNITAKEIKNLKKWINALQLDSQYGLVRSLKYKFEESFGQDDGIHLILGLLNIIDKDLINRCVAHTDSIKEEEEK
jgi:hypothetical protein